MIIDRCHCLLLLFCFWVVVCKMSKKNLLCADLSKNLFQLGHFNLAHLEDLIALFRRMLWFIGFWPILGRYRKFKFRKGADSSKICDLKSWYLLNCSSKSYKTCHFLKVCCEIFSIHYIKLHQVKRFLLTST